MIQATSWSVPVIKAVIHVTSWSVPVIKAMILVTSWSVAVIKAMIHVTSWSVPVITAMIQVKSWSSHEKICNFLKEINILGKKIKLQITFSYVCVLLTF